MSRRRGWHQRDSAMTAAASAALAVVTAAVFWPLLGNGFLNWDDAEVLTGNDALRLPAPSLLAWAFSTVHMSHYQPLSWLALAWLGGAPPDPARVHAVALALHALNAGLVLWLAVQILRPLAAGTGLLLSAFAAAALFAVHPLRVEPVAWASALPYLLSYALLLPSVACWFAWLRHDRRRDLVVAVVLFTLSQLARVTAPLWPLVLAAAAWADPAAKRRNARGVASAILPFVLVAIPLAAVEAGARNVEALSDVPWAARLASTLSNPAVYLWRTLWPVALTPLDVLPRVPAADWPRALLAAAAVAAVVVITVRLTSSRAALSVWGSIAALLAPVAGLTPSGLQLTADRYTYGPAAILTVGLAASILRVPVRLRGVLAGLCLVTALPLTAVTRTQLGYWRDSVTLWSRAATLDPQNDVAAYNLANALRDAGRPDDAIAELTRLMALVPDHGPGATLLARLSSDREMAAATAAAGAGRVAEAVAGFDRALALQPARLDARVNRGMALLSLGDVARAVPDLEAAVQAGRDDAAVVNALAFAWTSVNRAADAVRLLAAAQARHADDAGVTNNLARLLLTAEPPSLRDPARALALASDLDRLGGGRDPRLLDTLALAQAANGRAADARATWMRALQIARQAGDTALAGEFTRRLASR